MRDSTGKPLSSVPLVKRWIHPAVIREEVEEDGICGTLFKPPGEGPFSSILDLSGTGGGINEHKGAALASEGFCVLSLAYFQYKTLITDLNDLDLDYFEIIAVCSINGTHVIGEIVKIKEHGKRLPYTEIPADKIYYINQALCYDKSVKHMEITEETDLKIETSPRRTAFRLVASLDDLSTSTVFVTRYLEKKLRDSSHYVEVDMVPGGHVMDPPYFPAHQVVYSKFADSIQAYGGEPCIHGASESKAWSNTIAFFKKFLGSPRPLGDYRRIVATARSHL
ncbi:unnamed protein product [Strongylus vulgaris]|uniref:BAAT/Acyl-CoA thioester hydrolase C-terminal domain-containing protein n=1 Tax=Strongylus vulgaris TaxID=40348 RepID=A0A3P7J3A5_STRVU|nr:unnamed protein product [Strongylus vulgaris]